MQHFLHSLLIGVTTVFAWTPASILLILAFFGIYTGLLYFDEVGLVRLVALIAIAVAAIAGFLGLTSICWGLKLKPKVRLACLLSGTLALASVIMIGNLSDNELLHIRFSIVEIYLFICPLLFLIIHVLLDGIKAIRKPPY